MVLRFHSQVFDFLGEPPVRSTSAERVLEARERALGVRFPASFREWYAIEGALDLLAETFDRETLESAEWSQDLSARKILYLPGCTCQGGTHFIELDGGSAADDPVVFGEEFETVADGPGSKLSDFIFGVVWDGRSSPFAATLDRAPPGGPELAALAERFTARPGTTWSVQRTLRFQDGPRRLTIRQGTAPLAAWELGAESVESLLHLADQLVRLGLFSVEDFRSHAALKVPCRACGATVFALDRRCPWCGGETRPRPE